MPSAACNGSQGFSGDGGPATQFQVSDGSVPAQLAGTTVSFNGVNGPIVYTSNTQVAAIVPYEVTGSSAQVVVSYQGQASPAFTVPVAASAPSLFSLNETGAGQAAAINAVDNTVNTAANPVKIGGYISLYATGQGRKPHPRGWMAKLHRGRCCRCPTCR
jgi:uncharacterized protein (TIGR03437 family)